MGRGPGEPGQGGEGAPEGGPAGGGGVAGGPGGGGALGGAEGSGVLGGPGGGGVLGGPGGGAGWQGGALDVLVLRVSSLGDVVLAGAVTGGLGRVGFVTERRYIDVVSRFTSVEAVFEVSDTLPSGVPRVDLQHQPKSRWFGGRRVERQDLRRWGRVFWKGVAAEKVVERYARAVGGNVSAGPWVRSRRTPGGAEPRWTRPVGADGTLVLAPGAAHRNKRWGGWSALAARWPGEVAVIGGPGDEEVVGALGGTVERGFERTIERLEGAALCVAGDTGLLHLAGGMGVPVVGLFGPTTSADGFWCHAGEVVELPLPCRPCGKYGGGGCPVGDHACMAGISVERVWAAVERVRARAAVGG